MEIEDFKAVVNSTTYKPGWRFELAYDESMAAGMMGQRLKVIHEVVSTVTGEIIDVELQRALSDRHIDSLNTESAREWVHDIILSAERHEMYEHLRFDGEHFVPPHLFGRGVD